MKKPLRNILYLAVLFVFILGGCTLKEKNVFNESKEGSKIDSDSKSPLAPDFRLNDLSGKEALLSSYLGKKAVVLFFWTTWCPYCREALKDLEADYVSLARDGVIVLTINVGERKGKVAKFIKDRKLSFRVLLDINNYVADKYELMGVPSYFLINKEGRIVFAGNYFPKKEIKEITDVR